MPQDRICNRDVARRLLARTTLCGALAATMIFSGTAAWAADDGDGPSVMSSIMHAIGLKASGETYGGIDYNERSPLVVPPTRDLPPPVSNSAPPVANWPKDVDVARKKQAKVDNSAHYQAGDSVMNDSRVLTRSELDRPGAIRSNGSGGDSTADSQMADPRDHGAKKSIFSSLFHKDQQYATFTGEPSRSSLTDPPPGYLTPSPDQPYGVGPAESKYQVPTVATRMEPTR